MTESSCVITFMNKEDILSGHVGAPNPACGQFFIYLYIYKLLYVILGIL